MGVLALVNMKRNMYSLRMVDHRIYDFLWTLSSQLDQLMPVMFSLEPKYKLLVLRERAERPFRCLDCQYRRELVRVYLTNVEQICRRFVEERRGKLGKLIEDKARWSRYRWHSVHLSFLFTQFQ